MNSAVFFEEAVNVIITYAQGKLLISHANPPASLAWRARDARAQRLKSKPCAFAALRDAF